MAEQFRASYTEEELVKILRPEPGKEGKSLLDLTEANVCNFKNSGVAEENIHRPDLCTCCNSSWMHSHRGSGGKRGGMCAFLYIK